MDGVAPYTPNVYGLDTLATSDETWYDTMDETFQLGIDDNGLISAYCLDSFRATGDKKDNVDLISWEDALKKLPEAVNKYLHSATRWRMEASIRIIQYSSSC